MAAAWGLVVAAPVAAFLLLCYALRPGDRDDVVAPTRLAVVRAALAVGGYAVLTVEVAGAFDALTRPVIGAVWLVGALLSVLASLARRVGSSGIGFPRALASLRSRAPQPRRHPPALSWLALASLGRRAGSEGAVFLRAGRCANWWRAATRAERVMVVTLAGVVLAEACLALLAPPNNFDSQTYHLPRIEHWVAQRDLGFYPTAIHRQITLAPGAEYLLLHLRLLTGGDALHHLVQWAAGLGCLVATSRIAAQLGGSPRAQLITAFLAGTVPMVVLQATSTQNDLVTAAWAACTATLALDGLARRATAGSALALGVATGLTAITKNTGLLAAGPLLVLWVAGQIRLRTPGATGVATRVATTATAAAGVLVVAAALAGPFVARIQAEFGHPLGPPVLRTSVPMQRHDPPAVLVNGLRIGHTALDTPVRPLAGVTADAIIGFARLIRVDPQDRDITFGFERFPVSAWYPAEDRAAYPIAGGLALIGVGVALIRPRRLAARAGLVRAYAATVTAAGVLYVATVKWQTWGNRLLLFALLLAVPLAGLWLAALPHRRPAALPDRPGEPGRPADTGRRERLATRVVAAVLAVSALAAVLTVGYGHPRRLVGAGSAVTTGDWAGRFGRHQDWAAQFRWAAAAVEASGAHRLGLVQQNDTWEYPWWLLLRDHEIVSLQSVLPHHPPPDPATVDAIICGGDRRVCARIVPAGWRMEHRGYAGYAVPPNPRRPPRRP